MAAEQAEVRALEAEIAALKRAFEELPARGQHAAGVQYVALLRSSGAGGSFPSQAFRTCPQNRGNTRRGGNANGPGTTACGTLARGPLRAGPGAAGRRGAVSGGCVRAAPRRPAGPGRRAPSVLVPRPGP